MPWFKHCTGCIKLDCYSLLAQLRQCGGVTQMVAIEKLGVCVDELTTHLCWCCSSAADPPAPAAVLCVGGGEAARMSLLLLVQPCCSPAPAGCAGLLHCGLYQ